jgi:putative component of toxin-antitoxin plasmid stabilization module
VLEIPRYLAGSGNDVFGAWMSGLQYDRTKGKIVARIDRLSLGNFGDCKALYKGLFELRIDWGGQATESITRWRAELAWCCFVARRAQTAI